jgi:hypothetical protein
VQETVNPWEIATDDLAALALAGLPEKAFETVRVLPLQTPPGSTPLWAVHSYGMQNWDLQPIVGHFVALYTLDRRGGEWTELDRIDLLGDGAEQLGPNYLDENGVTQVFIEPTHIWLEVQGGAGAHSGTYQILSWDGEKMALEVAHFTASPGGSSIRDLNGDGFGDIVLDASDPYVFCYACGVSRIGFVVHSWDPRDGRLIEKALEPLSEEEKEHPAVQEVNKAVSLAKAGLWRDAQSSITAARKAAHEAGAARNDTLEWDYGLIRLHAQALMSAAYGSGYPILGQVFYGDYGMAVGQLRQYPPEEIFSLKSPAVAGTVAENWTRELSEALTSSATAALDASPDLAPAYFLRAWGTFLLAPNAEAAREDLRRAAELAPDDVLYAASAEYLANSVFETNPVPTATK